MRESASVRVVHLSTFDHAGGAARATWRLHHALRAAGAESTLLARSTSSATPHVMHYRASPLLGDRLRRNVARVRCRRLDAAIARRRAPGIEQFNTDRGLFGAELAASLPACDIIHLHWTSGFVDLPAFLPPAQQRAPVVVTLHDVNALTGGCHYPGGCERWKTGCGQCPQLSADPAEPVTAPSWARRHAAYGHGGKLAFIATSRWSEQMAAGSPLAADRPRHRIPLGVDLAVFAPRGRDVARQILGLPTDAEIVLFVADATDIPRKGFDVLADAMGRLRDRPRLLAVSVGRSGGNLAASIPHRGFGTVSDERMLSLIYSAADVFVIPSREEAFGQTTLEAFACGVPAVGSATGGITDLVRPQETGLLAAVGDGAAFAAAIATLLDHPTERARMGARARRVAEDEFSLTDIARRHVELYRTLIV
jgi:glycosyltransferase involved in cell wall biosynthesis